MCVAFRGPPQPVDTCEAASFSFPPPPLLKRLRFQLIGLHERRERERETKKKNESNVRHERHFLFSFTTSAPVGAAYAAYYIM